MTTMQSRIEELVREQAAEYAAFVKKAVADAGDDTEKLQTSLMAYQTALQEKAKSQAEAEARSRNELAKTRTTVREAFRTHALDVMGKAWSGILAEFAKLDSDARFTFAVGREDDGTPSTPHATVADRLTKVKPATGSRATNGARSVPLTVNGITYPSASAAKEALIPAKKDQSMSRAAIISALKTANKTVTE